MALTKADIKNIQQGIKSTVKDAVVEAVDPYFAAIEKDFNNVYERFENVDKRFDKIDERLEKIEKFLLEDHRRRIEKLEMEVKE